MINEWQQTDRYFLTANSIGHSQQLVWDKITVLNCSTGFWSRLQGKGLICSVKVMSHETIRNDNF